MFYFFFYIQKFVYSGFGAFLYSINHCNKDKNLTLVTADKVTNKAYSDDADSVLYWVQEMQCEEFNPVLFFKPQGQKSDFNGVEEKDFLLALQTQFQKEMFEKHAQKLICVDTTHGTTAYDFQLVTVLVIDDYNEGIPVAWLISNKETTDALKIFFSSLRECCGEVQTETFMSDDADAYYNDWVSTFSWPDRKLLSSWHVDCSW